MKQAIEEGFILDVLANYTTYKSFYEIQKSIEDNPMFESKKAQRILRAYVEASQQSIDAKASIMLEHFIDNVVNKKKLKGVAKGMVVTQSIEAAIRYYLSLKRLLEQKNNPFNIMIAFSGEKEVDGKTYTEESLNGFNDAKTNGLCVVRIKFFLSNKQFLTKYLINSCCAFGYKFNSGSSTTKLKLYSSFKDFAYSTKSNIGIIDCKPDADSNKSTLSVLL